MKSVEANLVEGGVGDFWIVGGDNDGVKGTCDVVEKNGMRIFNPKEGKPVEITSNGQGAFHWYGWSTNWQDVKGFHVPGSYEKPDDWNLLEIYAVGSEMQMYLNGKFVNRVYGLSLTNGKIQLQSEGAEIFFRRVSLRPGNEPLD